MTSAKASSSTKNSTRAAPISRYSTAADHVEHQQRKEGEADEQEAVFDRAIDLRIEVDRLDQVDLRGLRRVRTAGVGRAVPLRARLWRRWGRTGIAGADQRAAQREVADAVGGVESLRGHGRVVGQEIAGEARARPRRMDRPARVRCLWCQRDRLVAAQVE